VADGGYLGVWGMGVEKLDVLGILEKQKREV